MLINGIFPDAETAKMPTAKNNKKKILNTLKTLCFKVKLNALFVTERTKARIKLSSSR